MLPACQQDRYEIKEDKYGRTLRLDKKTGELVVIDGSRMTEVKTEEKLAEEKHQHEVQAAPLRLPKEWAAIDISPIGVNSAKLTTVWKSDLIQYRLIIEPVPSALVIEKSNWPLSPFTLILLDQNQFKVVETEVYSSSITSLISDNGKPSGLSIEGTINCSREQYESLYSWSLAWRF